MLSTRLLSAGVLLVSLATACGHPKDAAAPSTTTPSVTASFEPAALEATITAGDEVRLEAVVTLATSDGSTCHPVLSGPASLLPQPEFLASLAPGKYRIALVTPPDLAEGDLAGALSLHACRDAACTSEYAGSPFASPYHLAVRRAPDWETYQGNAAHSGYVPMTLDPARFHQIWTWTSPNAAGGVMQFINPVAVSHGLVAVSDDDYSSPQAVYVLNEADGSVRWKHDFDSDLPGLNPPAIQAGTVFVATSGHEDTFLHAFSADDGTLLVKTPFSAQWEHYLAPTVVNGVVYQAGGYFGGLYAFREADGVQAWFCDALPQVDMFTPAVDAEHAYVAAGGSLHVIDRATGVVAYAIDDPQPSQTGYDHLGAPVLGGRGNVITWSGDDFSGRASASTGGHSARALLSNDLASRTIAWRSEQAYLTQPAVAKGVVYAGSRSPLRLAALDEADGHVLWSWTPDDGSSDFCRNVIVTDSHAFVSTSTHVHAIDLATHQTVWSQATPGELALSSAGTLLIGEGCRESTGRLLAIRLR